MKHLLSLFSCVFVMANKFDVTRNLRDDEGNVEEVTRNTCYIRETELIQLIENGLIATNKVNGQLRVTGVTSINFWFKNNDDIRDLTEEEKETLIRFASVFFEGINDLQVSSRQDRESGSYFKVAAQLWGTSMTGDEIEAKLAELAARHS